MLFRPLSIGLPGSYTQLIPIWNLYSKEAPGKRYTNRPDLWSGLFARKRREEENRLDVSCLGRLWAKPAR